MNQRTHPIVDPVLAVLACIMALALCLAAGCASPRNGAPCYALVNFAPAMSLKLQIGGSDATVTVVNRQEGIANQIKKDTPIDAKVDGRATLEASGLP